MNDEILTELKEQTKWLKFLAYTNLKQVLVDTLVTNDLKEMYQLSDGNLSTNEISNELKKKGIKVSNKTVHNYWSRWKGLGIVEPSENYKGRFQRIVDLKDFNLT